MDQASLNFMKYFRDTYLADKKGWTVLDVGSRAVYGQKATFRPIFRAYNKFKYTGMDIVAGRNVDIVGYENIKGKYNVVISGNVMEHVKRPWDWLKNLIQYFTDYICIIAPHTWKEHRHPIDTYRYFPDGMRDLFEYAGIKAIEIKKDSNSTFGIGTHL